MAHYVYDHSGERVLKTIITGSILNTNSQGQSVLRMESPTVYVNPYYIASHYLETELASKHYYMGGQRIASALVSLPFNAGSQTDPGMGGEGEEGEGPVFGEGNLSTSEDAVIQDLSATFNCLFGRTIELDYNGMLKLISIGEPILFDDCEGGESSEASEIDPTCACEQSTYWAQIGGVACNTMPIMYWYHPDYLGSVEFVTDMNGNPYQFFHNTIWGENLQNHMAFSFKSFSSRFRFNGKEWDDETGNFYYGARYYDPKISVWLSVDPLAEKYPSLSSYTFVANNPLILIDPDGREIVITGSDGSKTVYKPGGNYEGNDQFTQQVIADYDAAYSGSAEARKHINNIVDSEHCFDVVKSNDPNRKTAFAPNIVTDQRTGNKTLEGGQITIGAQSLVPVQKNRKSLTSTLAANSMMTLLHETAHASRAEDQIWDNVPSFGSTGASIEELETCHIENIIRSELSLPLRTHYEVTTDSKGNQYGSGFQLLKFKGGIISNYHWKNAKKKIEY